MNIIQTDTLIIGFGFSCLPLIRELDNTDSEFMIISDKDSGSVWDSLKSNDRLDFDLVSSFTTSWYSFDLVSSKSEDYYPTAKEFFDMHLRYRKKYNDRIINDYVELIENYDGYSIISTKKGNKYKAKNVVISVGFKRKILEDLTNFDYSLQNKTIVFNTIGDSANLMIAKLIAGNNKILCLTNGFLALEKMWALKHSSYTVDQIEFHNIGLYLSTKLYRQSIGASPFIFDMAYGKGIRKKISFHLGKIFEPSLFWYQNPEFFRSYDCDLDRLKNGAGFFNGVIAIKNWPIDTYSQLFGDNLEDSIKKGYLLNDILFWKKTGLVELLRKDKVKLDKSMQQLDYNGKVIDYDYLVEGEPEIPRLPAIEVAGDNHSEEYEYKVRDNYLGVIPKKLKNVYILGSIRPTTGGLANITEMQSLLIHKMCVNKEFNDKIYSDLSDRIEKYNMHYYPSEKTTTVDHLVFYGFYTNEVAKTIGIDLKPKDCKSITDFSKFYFFPNNAFKYRQKGEYKVEGCEELVERIDKHHKRWLGMKYVILSDILHHISFLSFSVKMFLDSNISLPVFIILLILQFFARKPILSYNFRAVPLVIYNPYSHLRMAYTILGTSSVLFVNKFYFLPFILGELLMTGIVRVFKVSLARNLFNDMKMRDGYEKFLKRYLQTYRRVVHNIHD